MEDFALHNFGLMLALGHDRPTDITANSLDAGGSTPGSLHNTTRLTDPSICKGRVAFAERLLPCGRFLKFDVGQLYMADQAARGSDVSGFHRNYLLTEPRTNGASVSYEFGGQFAFGAGGAGSPGRGSR